MTRWRLIKWYNMYICKMATTTTTILSHTHITHACLVMHINANNLLVKGTNNNGATPKNMCMYVCVFKHTTDDRRCRRVLQTTTTAMTLTKTQTTTTTTAMTLTQTQTARQI
eukprot:GHVS01053825.1.p1 GENE.GHVS01053825.1~~GHVS01053825.1.p1  ORF type:complete len:112 (+),score=34.61 GHVS01053825.1:73-408(+)